MFDKLVLHRLAPHAVDLVFQRTREQARHLGDERLQLSQSIARGEHDDDRDRQCADVLLMFDAPIHGDSGVEALGSGKGQQETVRGTRPPMP